jgi:hypothetical protein
MPKRQRWMIGVAGAVGVLALITYAVTVVAGGELDRGVRLGAQLIGLAAWAPMFLLQRSWDRVHRIFGPDDDDDAYESLWGPGLVAVIAGNILQAALLGGAASSE